MPRTISGNAEAAVRAFAEGDDGAAASYTVELYQICAGHDEEARRALVDAGLPRALVERMTVYAFGQAKKLNLLRARLYICLSDDEADTLLAEVFAEKASQLGNIISRSRLYKLACRHARNSDVVTKTFRELQVAVIPPLDGRHLMALDAAKAVNHELAPLPYH